MYISELEEKIEILLEKLERYLYDDIIIHHMKEKDRLDIINYLIFKIEEYNIILDYKYDEFNSIFLNWEYTTLLGNAFTVFTSVTELPLPYWFPNATENAGSPA